MGYLTISNAHGWNSVRTYVVRQIGTKWTYLVPIGKLLIGLHVRLRVPAATAKQAPRITASLAMRDRLRATLLKHPVSAS